MTARTPLQKRVDKMRKFYADAPDVRERQAPDRKGVVVGVDADGLVQVQWAGASYVGFVTEDELITPRLTKHKREELPGVVDAFADVRGFLGSDANDDANLDHR